MDAEQQDYADRPPDPPRPWWVKDVAYPAVVGLAVVLVVLTIMYLAIRTHD
jgi:hypothetical protein